MPKTALSGTRIRLLRTARRMGQADLARLAGVSASYLNLIEHNRRRASPKVLDAIAEALQIPAEELEENAGEALVTALRAAAARGASGAVLPEVDRVEELTGRFPGWAALMVQMQARTEALERTLERLSDRMAHDPNLSASLHEIVSAATAVQSTAAILAESEDLAPDWRARFHTNVHADSVRLVHAAESLVAFLDTTGEETALAAPNEEVESWLARHDWHIAALEEPGTDLSALVAGQPELASAAARSLARAWAERARADAAALPLARLAPALTAMFAGPAGFAPEALARSFGSGLATLFRRLAALPALPGVPRFGLVLCDGSGTLTFRRPLEGFALPRFGGGCPLWPLYQALVQPDRPLRAVVEFAGRPPARLVAHAVAGARDPLRFEPPFVWDSSMLLTPASAALPGDSAQPPLPVGSSCRVCPRLTCAARREPSIVAGSQDASGAAVGL